MNKIILLSALAISLAAVSCKKERTCECTNTTTNVKNFDNGISTTDTDVNTSKVTSEKQSKKYFRTHQNCYSYTNKQTHPEIGYTTERTQVTECTLK